MSENCIRTLEDGRRQFQYSEAETLNAVEQHSQMAEEPISHPDRRWLNASEIFKLATFLLANLLLSILNLLPGVLIYSFITENMLHPQSSAQGLVNDSSRGYFIIIPLVLAYLVIWSILNVLMINSMRYRRSAYWIAAVVINLSPTALFFTYTLVIYPT